MSRAAWPRLTAPSLLPWPSCGRRWWPSPRVSLHRRRRGDLSISQWGQSRRVFREPRWATRNRVALELPTVRLRDFSTDPAGVPDPDLRAFRASQLHDNRLRSPSQPGRSVASRGYQARLAVTDWRSASSRMRFLSIDNYLADLNVLVDELGGAVDLIGLCQGGWMALVYAARFPAKVRKLVLAGAPIDIAAGASSFPTWRAIRPWLSSGNWSNSAADAFSASMHCGSGLRIRPTERQSVNYCRCSDTTSSGAFRRLESRFRDWYAWTVDLPGTYYLQVVERLFKDNRLATGRFVALGRKIDLSVLRCPLFLLAARDDDVVAREQIFATRAPRRLISTARSRRPWHHAGISACSWARRSSPTSGQTVARWLLR